MRKLNIVKLCLLTAIFSLNGGFFTSAAEGKADSFLSRGEATDLVVKFFDLEGKNKNFLKNCDIDLNTCLFTFSTRTDFADLSMEPLILYPDVYPAYRFYESINIASKIDLVRGYYLSENSPYRPEQPITKVEALKLTMGASGMLDWKEQFEVNAVQTTWLSFNFDGDRWWYGRYLATALQKGILAEVSAQEADETISKDEFVAIMKNANKIVATGQTSSLADISRQSNNLAGNSANSEIKQ